MSPGTAVLYGLIQGLTEFLPVSSSGHLRLAHRLGLGHLPSEQEFVFDVMLHGATLLAIFLAFRKEIFSILSAPPKFFGALALSVIPAGLVGLWVRDWVDLAGQSLVFIGFCFLANAGILFLGSRGYQSTNNKKLVSWKNEPSPKQGLAVGLLHIFALLPGISRSGVCVSAGLRSGLAPASAVAYAFVAGIPLLSAAVGLDLMTGKSSSLLATVGWTSISVGAGTALASGWGAALLLRRLVMAGKLQWFAGYSALLGLAILLLH